MMPLLAQQAAASADAGADGISLIEVLSPYMGVFFVAFFGTIMTVPLMRALAIRNGIIDWPDLKRKAHIQPVAYLGGVGIFIGWLAGVLACFFLVHGASFPIELILGAAVITLTGLFDDIYGIRARVKVGGQLFAAAALASVSFTGVRGQAIGVQLIDACLHVIGLTDVAPWLVYMIGTLVIAAFVLGGCNAVNLIDGLDGLASGVTAIAVVGFLVVASIVGVRHAEFAGGVNMLWPSDTVRIVVCLALLGAICGFLPYNFNPATIFMGDAGSLLLGYLSVSIILLFADVGSDAAVPTNALKIVTACLIIFALPITDTSLAIIRRKIRGQSIFAPDSQHMHHLLRKRGLSVKKSVLVMYIMGMIFAALGVAMIALDLPWRYVLAVFVVLYGFIMVTAFKMGQQQLIREKMRQQQAVVVATNGRGERSQEPPPEAPAEGEQRDRKRRRPEQTEDTTPTPSE